MAKTIADLDVEKDKELIEQIEEMFKRMEFKRVLLELCVTEIEELQSSIDIMLTMKWIKGDNHDSH